MSFILTSKPVLIQLLISLLSLATVSTEGKPQAGHFGGYGYHQQPAYGAYGHGHNAYKQQHDANSYLQHNCSLHEVTEVVEVCTPTIATECSDETLPIKVISDGEYCYTESKTVCSVTIEVVDNEVCTYTYETRTEDATAKNVEVGFEQKTDVQMITVCQPSAYQPARYGSKYDAQNAYAPQQCNPIQQETAYNVPIVKDIEVPVQLTLPTPGYMRICRE